MEYLLKIDWLNREPPYSFQWDHLLFVFISIILGVFLSLYLRRKSKEVVKIWLIVLWIVATVSELTFFILQYVLCATDPANFTFNIDYMLPIHSCFMFMYIFPVAMFVKNKTIKLAATNFLVVVNMIMGFITMFVGCPSKGYSALSYPGLQSIFYHAIIFIVPLIMVVTNYYDLQKWDIKYGISCFGILATLIWIFDAITGSDYFYIYDGHCFGILYEISENVHHLVWTLIVVSCYVITAFIIHFLIYYLKLFLSKKFHKEEEVPVEQN